MVGAGLLAVGAAGGLLLLLTLADLFATIFNYDGYTFITARMHRVIWIGLRAFSRLLPTKARHGFLSLGSAAMLPATLVGWLSLEISAFAMIFLPGLVAGSFILNDHTGAGIGSAYYLSGGAITSLTFGDILARSGLYRALIDLETVIGLATFTLALTYVLTAFDVLGSLNALHGRVRRQAVQPNRPATILARYFHGGDPGELSSLLQSLIDDLDSYDQGLRRYPVVFYFHSRRAERSIPRVFASLGDLVELLRWGLPGDHQLSSNPNLLALADQYTITVARLQRSFVGPSDLEPPQPAPAEQFWAEYGDARASGYIGELRHLRQTASEASGLGPGEEDQETYARYREWLPFHHRRLIFLERVTVALGY